LARNGSGTYTVVNTFVAGDTITAASHNQNWSDLASELTNSVAADGQTTLTGPIRAASGTAAAPGVTFGSDTDSGLYRIGSNNVGVAVNGALVVDVATTGLAVTGNASATGDVSATGVVNQGGFALLPAGVIFPYGGAAAPTGYLLCAGQSLLRASYPALFTAINTQYGAADGTHFSLPDLRGRVVAGDDNMTGSAANRLTSTYFGTAATDLGAAGGDEKSTLVTANLPAYTPAGSVSTTGTIPYSAQSFSVGPSGTSIAVQTSTTAITASSSFTGTAQGGLSTPVRTIQPTIILNYIIFAGV
jgi:microcystin-dependent protein